MNEKKLLAMVSAVLLWSLPALAFQGPPAPVTVQQANRTVAQVVTIGAFFSADLLTTGWALAKCPNCIEGNWLGPNPESRQALKMGMWAAQSGLVWLLESKGKHKVAVGLTVGSCAVSAMAIVNNTKHIIKKQ
jgi:hypothetical protein